MMLVGPSLTGLLQRAPARSFAAQPLPLQGFGAGVTGGGTWHPDKVIEVTNLNDSGPGSFRDACASTMSPKIIDVKVAGYITLSGRVSLGAGDVTISGRNAPGMGACIRGKSDNHKNLLSVDRENVLIEHMRFRRGTPSWQTGTSSFCVSISAPRVALRFCSISWGGNDCLTIWNAGHSAQVSIEYCMLYQSLQTDADGSSGGRLFNIGSNSGTSGVSVHRCILAHTRMRLTRIQIDAFEMVNCLGYNWRSNCHTITGDDNSLVRCNFLGNRWAAGVDHTGNLPITPQSSVGNGSIYIDDNEFIDESGNLIIGDGVSNKGSNPQRYTDTRWNFTSFDGYVAPTVLPREDLLGHLLAHAGAKLPARDNADEIILNHIQPAMNIHGKPGSIINCVCPDDTSAGAPTGQPECPAHAGCWPELA